MDYTDLSPSEWAMLNGTNNNTDDDILAPTQSSDALAKATKDLMALSAGRWDSLPQQQHGVYTHHLEQHHHHQTHPNVYSHRQTSYRTETFPFLNPKAQMHHSMLSLPPHSTDLHAHMTSPIPTSTSTSATTTPATPQSPFCFPDLSSHSSSHLQLPQVHLNQPLLRQQRPPSPGPKRSSSNAASSAKRLRPSPPTTSSSIASSSAGPTKQTLLSPSQKKANHIQSEQKRRANIRRGYEALCDTVPALREAIREEEEAEARMSMGLGSSGKPSRSKRKKKDTAGDDKEKIDGRAGPRSENVVLSKSMWHVISSVPFQRLSVKIEYLTHRSVPSSN